MHCVIFVKKIPNILYDMYDDKKCVVIFWNIVEFVYNNIFRLN